MQRYGWPTIVTQLSQKQRSCWKEGLLWKMVKPRPADSAAVAWTHESCGRMDGNRWERWLSLSVISITCNIIWGSRDRVYWEFQTLSCCFWFQLFFLIFSGPSRPTQTCLRWFPEIRSTHSTGGSAVIPGQMVSSSPAAERFYEVPIAMDDEPKDANEINTVKGEERRWCHPRSFFWWSYPCRGWDWRQGGSSTGYAFILF